jgi:glycine betaine catabolism B
MNDKITVKGPLRDIVNFITLTRSRRKRIRSASTDPAGPCQVNLLAEKLHPKKLSLRISSVQKETGDTRTYVLERALDTKAPGRPNLSELPFFRAGQYLSFKLKANDYNVTRPYSISSDSRDALEGRYEVTVKKRESGFITPYIWENWKEGTMIESSGPLGQFYYEPLRDKEDVTCIAGGCGITPFKPLIRDILESSPTTGVTLLYGITSTREILFKEALEILKTDYKDRFSYFYIYSGSDDNWNGERGLITAAIIRKYTAAPEENTFFLCGPEKMYTHLNKELGEFNLPPGRIRQEVNGEIGDITGYPGFPAGMEGQSFTLTVHMENRIVKVPADGTETVLVATERAGLNPPSECRSGECGWCRARLSMGEVFIIKERDGRRKADIKFGYFHPCASYPLSDLEIFVPSGP